MADKFDPKEHSLTEDQLNEIKFTNLKNHTGYTLQMGYGTTKEHIKACAKKGHQACVFTDNGVMMGALDLYNQAQDKKILEAIHYEGKSFPIIMGVSLYLTEDTNIKNRAQKHFNLTMYAKNQAGYENLCFLTSIGSLEEKFYVRPRIDLSDIFSNKEGVVCASGGFSGMISQAISENKGYFREELFSLIEDKDQKEALLDYLDKFHEVNAPDKVSKLIEVMNVAPEKEEFWRKYLIDSSFWQMFPIVLKSPELIQLLKETQDKFPLDKVDFLLPETMTWDADESSSEQIKGAFFNILSDVKPEIIVKRFKDEYKDDFYLEMSNTDLRWRWVKDLKQHEDIGENPQDRVNKRLVELSEEFGVKIILVQDTYITEADQHLLQSIMIWNSPGGKDGWHFYEPLNIMTVPEMYEKTINNYPWISDEQFVEWTSNSDEVLQKCRDCKLSFEPSLPVLDYTSHYVNKVPSVIRRSLIFELQERKLWSETLKAKIIELQDLSSFTELPEDIKQEFSTRETVLDLDDMEKRKEENVFLENVLIKMKSFYKKEKELVKVLKRSESDLALRTSLKVMIRNKKLLPKIIDEVRLNKIIAERAPGKTHADFKSEVIQNIISKYNLFKIADDPMLLLGEQAQRERLVEEINTIQYNGILQLMTYFMLLEDVSNFVAENGYLRGFGRGSGAGSIVAYALDITDCDPLEYNLLFERFLTTERIGEIFYEIDGFSLKEFLASQNQQISTIDISTDDLKLDDDATDLGDESGEPGEDL